ncbi:uncharacterized protein L203_106132 [Cryptococcus depauperatus CBS 7841]|uniref:DHHA2 domain-containing protein n=1 Tax=Cryptococcus depauperatus CBS 7841 TaxID=1295531 RepID=A0AAJ8M4N8_9TREE
MSKAGVISEGNGEGRLAGFLSSQKNSFLQDLKDGKGKGWIVVMGNEAGDLDSLASSIAFSQLSATLNASRVVPLVLTPPKYMTLRPENLLVLQKTFIPLTSLLHASELPMLSSDLSKQGAKFALVDHNRLLPEFGAGHVEVVIDHHEDEGLHTDAAIRNITVPVGSCASLVTQHFKPQWEASLQHEAPIPAELATVLLSAILVDTAGLKPQGKATPIDYDSAEFLYRISTLPQPRNDVSFLSSPDGFSVPSPLTQLASILLETKSNISNLSTYELAMRDYKEYMWPTQAAAFPTLKVGLSTVPLSLKPWIERTPQGWNSLMQGIDEYMTERTLDIEGILTTFKSEKKGKHKRQLAVVVRSGGVIKDDDEAERVFDRLVQGLEGSGDILSLKRWKKEGTVRKENTKGKWVKIWVQGNTRSTRKQIAPLMKEIVATIQ